MKSIIGIERGYKFNRKSLLLVLLALVALLAQACSTPGELAVGDRAPAFSLPTSTGGQVALSDYRGESPVLLFFHMAVG